MRKIGIIGTGIMASGMALNFLKHGYEVFVWNRTWDRAEPLIKAGAQWRETPKEVTQLTDIVIECVTDDEASRNVWQGADGILAGATKDKILIASSSLSLIWTDELIHFCKDKDFQFMDMPLTGSRAGAENGTLRLLIGGDESTLELIRKDLEAISEKIYRFGDAGTGMRFKLMLNALIAIHMNAAAQSREVARKAGVDPEMFAQALFDGNMGPASPATKLVFDSSKWEEGRVNFALEWMEKDLRYAKQMAETYGSDFDLLNATQSDYNQAKEKGLAKADVTSIAQLFIDNQ